MLRWLIVYLLLPFFSLALAHPISVNSIKLKLDGSRVGENKYKMEVECFVEDLVLFHKIFPISNGNYLGYELMAKLKDHGNYLKESLTFFSEDGVRVVPKFTNLTTNFSSKKEIKIYDLMNYKIIYEYEFKTNSKKIIHAVDLLKLNRAIPTVYNWELQLRPEQKKFHFNSSNKSDPLVLELGGEKGSIVEKREMSIDVRENSKYKYLLITVPIFQAARILNFPLRKDEVIINDEVYQKIKLSLKNYLVGKIKINDSVIPLINASEPEKSKIKKAINTLSDEIKLSFPLSSSTKLNKMELSLFNPYLTKINLSYLGNTKELNSFDREFNFYSN